MRLTLCFLMISGLLAATGCSASRQDHAATPRASHVAGSSLDASWIPPGEEFTIEDDAPAQARRTTPRAMPEPNRRPVLRNQVHPAVY